MQSVGADGYYLLHNHPAGVSDASVADHNFTAQAALAVPGFRAHVVIDHNEYDVITMTGQGQHAYPNPTACYNNPYMDYNIHIVRDNVTT